MFIKNAPPSLHKEDSIRWYIVCTTLSATTVMDKTNSKKNLGKWRIVRAAFHSLLQDRLLVLTDGSS